MVLILDNMYSTSHNKCLKSNGGKVQNINDSGSHKLHIEVNVKDFRTPPILVVGNYESTK